MGGVALALRDAAGQVRRVVSNEDGRYLLTGIPDGAYSILASSKGFSPAEEDLVVGPQTRTRDITLRIGRAEETITVTMYTGASAPPFTPPPNASSGIATEQTCTTRFPETGIGGEVRSPTKIKNRPPVYPVIMASARLLGSATVAGVIGSDGKMQGVLVLKTSHPAFGEEMVRSLRAWEFLPARINCVPVNMTLTVTAHFNVAR